MDVRATNAAAAYAQRQTGPQAGAQTADGAQQAGGGFANLVKSVVNNAAEASREGEAVSMQALVNPGDLGSVVTAVTNAEITMQTVVAVRDRVVEAYKDILRMPI